jgi:hypothetical protein
VFAELEIGIFVDEAYVGVGFVVAEIEQARNEQSIKVVCHAVFARWFSSN